MESALPLVVLLSLVFYFTGLAAAGFIAGLMLFIVTVLLCLSLLPLGLIVYAAIVIYGLMSAVKWPSLTRPSA